MTPSDQVGILIICLFAGLLLPAGLPGLKLWLAVVVLVSAYLTPDQEVEDSVSSE